MNKWAILAVLVISAVAPGAQTAAPPTQTRTVNGSMGFPGTAYLGPAVKGKPYSAQRVTEHTQTLADGTHITRKPMTVQLYRDSAGRTREERPLMMGPDLPSDIATIVIINDPVEGYQYTVDVVHQVIHRLKATPFPRPNGATGAIAGVAGAAPPPPPPPPPPHNSSSLATSAAANGPVQHITPDGRTMTTENLGTQSIEGVVAEGHRTTMVIPAGLEGNDAPITTVNETWFSQQIGMSVLTKSSDPRNGENTIRLTNITLGDPDPALFQPPAGYDLVDETGSFQIQYTYKVPARP